jgi:hypothetical protein
MDSFSPVPSFSFLSTVVVIQRWGVGKFTITARPRTSFRKTSALGRLSEKCASISSCSQI